MKITITTEDKRFYEYRVTELFSMMMADKVNPDIPDVLMASFNIYLQKCIEHFQLVDRNDFIQQEYANLTEEKDLTEPILQPIDAINKKMFLKPTNGKFKKNRDHLPLIIMPQERVYDLKDPQLQHKKNVYLTYEPPHKETTEKNEIVEMQSKAER
jgi:hypothetical protein